MLCKEVYCTSIHMLTILILVKHTFLPGRVQIRKLKKVKMLKISKHICFFEQFLC